MTLYHCEICGDLDVAPVCDHCHKVLMQDAEDLRMAVTGRHTEEWEDSSERHIIDEYTARATLGLQLNSN